MRRCLLMLVGAVGLAMTHPGGAGDTKGEFEGTWEAVAMQRDGKDLKVQPGTLSVNTGERFVVKVGDKVIVAGTAKRDPTKKPRAIDITYTEGQDKGKTFKGIYEVDGDMAKFCRGSAPEQDRPTEFKTSADRPGFLVVYRRVKS